MLLRHIERSTKLRVAVERADEEGAREVHDAVFYDIHDLINESSFVVQSQSLYKAYGNLKSGDYLEISFTRGANVFTFFGSAIGKLRGDSVIIEQLTPIETLNRRQYQRDELRLDVRVYGLPEEWMNEPRFDGSIGGIVMNEVCFDVSSGGMCIITNKALKSDTDPYYLLEFAMTSKEKFFLPSILVRRSALARSMIGKFDYGFMFYFKQMPSEMSRLTKAIFEKKLSLVT